MDITLQILEAISIMMCLTGYILLVIWHTYQGTLLGLDKRVKNLRNHGWSLLLIGLLGVLMLNYYVI